MTTLERQFFVVAHPLKPLYASRTDWGISASLEAVRAERFLTIEEAKRWADRQKDLVEFGGYRICSVKITVEEVCEDNQKKTEELG